MLADIQLLTRFSVVTKRGINMTSWHYIFYI